MTSEDLWRATLHDFNNLLAGLQGVLDLSDPRAPLDPRNRMRLEATLEDGKTLIAMARTLALGRHPDLGHAPWSDWRAGVEQKMNPLAQIFRCPIEVVEGDGADRERWPMPVWQDWTVAFTRQILPWVAPEPLRIKASASAEAWVLTWLGDAPIPMALLPDPPPDAPRNLPSYWLRAMRDHLGLEVRQVEDGLQVSLRRQPRP